MSEKISVKIPDNQDSAPRLKRNIAVLWTFGKKKEDIKNPVKNIEIQILTGKNLLTTSLSIMLIMVFVQIYNQIHKSKRGAFKIQ